jgi:hypothetical protein
VTKEEFYAQARISSFFPLVFRTGARWNALSGKCGDCDREFEDRDLRGEVSSPFSSVFIVRATGFCSTCNLLTPFSYRLHEDMGMTGISPHTGEWVRWEAKPGTLFERLRKILGWARLEP